jgi:hypothetical protein
MFGGNLPLGSEILVQEHQNSGDNTEESTETEDDQVTDSLGKRRFSSEEGGLSIVSEEGGVFVILYKIHVLLGKVFNKKK